MSAVATRGERAIILACCVWLEESAVGTAGVVEGGLQQGNVIFPIVTTKTFQVATEEKKGGRNLTTYVI